MKNATFAALALFAATTILLGSTRAVAQSSGQEGMAERQAQGRTVSFRFEGGSARQYVEAVQRASGQKRIVVMPGCEAYVMPHVELDGVSLEGALSPLRYAWAEAPSNWMPLKVVREGDVFVVAPAWEQDEIEEEERTVVYSLAEALEDGGVRPEDVLTAAQAALEVSGADIDAMRFHKETRVLIVRGTDRVITAVEEVIDAVQQSAEIIQAVEDRGAALRRDVDVVRAQLVSRTQMIESAARMLGEIERSGEASGLDRMRALEELIGHEQVAAELRARLQELEEKLERWQSAQESEAR